MLQELARLLEDLARHELGHSLRMRRNARLLDLSGSDNMLMSQCLLDFAEAAMHRSHTLIHCCKRIGGHPRGSAQLPLMGLEVIDTDTILSQELVAALDAANSFREVVRYTGELDGRTRELLMNMRAEREAELAELARMLDEHRDRHITTIAA